MNMSTVYSELSLDYASALGGGNQISLFRIRTNNDNSGNVSGLVLNPMDAVPLAQRHLFEIQVVPTGDTGRIISNTFGAGYTRMDSAKRLTHRIERAVADAPGTTSGSLTCTVNVRRIAYHADAYSRQMVLNHSITTVGQVAPPPNSWNAQLPLPSAYQDSGWYRGANALVEFLFDPSGTIRLRTNYPNGQEVTLGSWRGTTADSSNTDIQVSVVNHGPLTTNNAATRVPLNQIRSFSLQTPTGVSSASARSTVRITLSNRVNPADSISIDVTLEVSLFPGGWGGDGGGGSGWAF